MSWFRVDDSFWLHKKTAAAGPVAIALWLACGSYASSNATDGTGWLDLGEVQLVAMKIGLKDWRDAMAKLIEVRFWDKHAGGVQFHNWEHYRKGGEQALVRRRETDAKRKREQRAREAARMAESEANVEMSRDMSADESRDVSRDVSREMSAPPTYQPTSERSLSSGSLSLISSSSLSDPPERHGDQDRASGVRGANVDQELFTDTPAPWAQSVADGIAMTTGKNFGDIRGPWVMYVNNLLEKNAQGDASPRVPSQAGWKVWLMRQENFAKKPRPLAAVSNKNMDAILAEAAERMARGGAQ